MLDCYIRITNGGTIYKEHVGSWIYSFLSSRYHDDGFGEYFNKSKVKAHSYYIDKENPKESDIVCISIRGISPIENKIRKLLDNTKFVRFGEVTGIIKYIDVREYTFKSIYNLQTPLIMRSPRLSYKHVKPEKKSLDILVKESIERKHELLYGEKIFGLLDIQIHVDSTINVPVIIRGKSVMHKAYTGRVEITATDEWLQFIQEVGLGNRTTYGYGAIG